jgi:biopolymer transport protein ExbB
MHGIIKKVLFCALGIFCSVGIVIAADGDPAAADPQTGMTLWQIIKSGGAMMIVLGFLSVAAVSLIIYEYICFTTKRICPKDFFEKAAAALQQGRLAQARQLCESQSNAISNIVKSGLDKKGHGSVFAREAMENTARVEVDSLWQNISYLSDIATIAPLVGLLGTVLGMIQAFNVIAFQVAVVKPIMLAGGVSKAMVTTAGGLLVAIPVMIFYSLLRAKVQRLTNIIESYTADLIRIMETL